MSKKHQYQATIEWTGNLGTGTDHYRNYERSHVIKIRDKEPIQGSSDPAFRGDLTKYNPEELLVSSLSACHMLWYLHLCSETGVHVISYVDYAEGTMEETSNGGGRFSEVILAPQVTVASPEMLEKAKLLHTKANEFCFIANSVNFPVKHSPAIKVIA